MSDEAELKGTLDELDRRIADLKSTIAEQRNRLQVIEKQREQAFQNWMDAKCNQPVPPEVIAEAEKKGRVVCTPGSPWKGGSAARWVHPNAYELYDGDDWRRMRCATCKVEWKEGLPQ